ncbi:type I glyceraldehyde-3-phosphate dehydrogenase [Rhizobium binxianense]|uniref:type I glyceraldehyde-3-phosphate dehydrogenase n=1 Tax=Rhizobium binxianense TaxID=3024242 RepID=UPI002361DEB1|nr:glyceraldehyde 3-phosphate dehydrogenase NAD-binding domain-containing protein [Rhizobium sp. MJ37]MDC9837563.1 glyceraldehyde 3-phosphate dehydrogenase NAD-binding domain-containing protein [Rhizobium sp. MJ37]
MQLVLWKKPSDAKRPVSFVRRALLHENGEPADLWVARSLMAPCTDAHEKQTDEVGGGGYCDSYHRKRIGTGIVKEGGRTMSQHRTRIAINGFGRIGRTILRILLSAQREFELVMINDVAPLESCAYLFQYDSIFGVWPEEVQTLEGALKIGSKIVPFHNVRDVRALDLSDVDVFLECTGQPYSREFISCALEAGASRVLISGPADAADVTVVLGANEEAIGDCRIVSNASCTTNALAPLLKVIDEAYEVVGGQMTTVHCYTGSQPTVDQPRDDFARSRAAALSMVPTSTSAHRLLGKVLPRLAGKIEARAIRVPTASVSAIDLTVSTRIEPSLDQVRAELKRGADATTVLGWTERPLVSVDMRARSESLIISGPEVSIAPGGLLRVFGWYDNEFGFASRMLDVASLLGATR